MTQKFNNHSILIVGDTNTGKTHAVRSLDKKVAYILTEPKRMLDNPTNFKVVPTTNPIEAKQFIEATIDKGFDYVVLDSLSFMLQQYPSKCFGATTKDGKLDGMKDWANYGNFFTRLINDTFPSLDCTFICISHTGDVKGKPRVPTQGKMLQATSIEAPFNTIWAAHYIGLDELEGHIEGNRYLTITEDDEYFQSKHVLQVQRKPDTGNYPIRTPEGFFKPRVETFIDNNLSKVLPDMIKHINNY